jgi:NADH-quinone oxidoreductase subunit E
VAVVMQVTPAYLSSLVTFYDMLRAEPLGSRYVYVCTSVACHLRNAKDVFDAVWEEARDQGLEDVEVREFECLGACDMAPMASVDGRYVGPLDTSDAAELVAAVKERREVLPGRGLEDSDYRVPTAEADRGATDHPSVHPAGGTVDHPEDEELDE